MDETSRDKLSGAMCDLLSNVIHIADEGNYERDSFVKASADAWWHALHLISRYRKSREKQGVP